MHADVWKEHAAAVLRENDLFSKDGSALSSKSSISIYQTTRHHVPTDSNLHYMLMVACVYVHMFVHVRIYIVTWIAIAR
jgi:hypothetical protein